jgi:hypothetical protein
LLARLCPRGPKVKYMNYVLFGNKSVELSFCRDIVDDWHDLIRKEVKKRTGDPSCVFVILKE